MKLLAILAIGVAWAQPGYVVGALTLTPEPWNKEANFAKLERYAREAASKGSEVIVAPEGFLEG